MYNFYRNLFPTAKKYIIEDGKPDLIIASSVHPLTMVAGIKIAKNIKQKTIIVLNPGRTFGAFEFLSIFEKYNIEHLPIIAETQTIIYTCRKVNEDTVNIISIKKDVLLSSISPKDNKDLINKIPNCLIKYFKPAKSIIETSIGNVGMILHCAPLLLNAGWTESDKHEYKYYYEGITPTIACLIEKIDRERVEVSKKLGLEVESTLDWMKRTYKITGDNLYECIQNNISYTTIDAPKSLNHRYVFEDIPCGLVPLEAIGKKLGLEMKNTSLIIDLGCQLLDFDFRQNGRNESSLKINNDFIENLKFKKEE